MCTAVFIIRVTFPYKIDVSYLVNDGSPLNVYTNLVFCWMEVDIVDELSVVFNSSSWGFELYQYIWGNYKTFMHKLNTIGMPLARPVSAVNYNVSIAETAFKRRAGSFILRFEK